MAESASSSSSKSTAPWIRTSREGDRVRMDFPDPARTVENIGRAAYAWSQANVQLFMGTAEVVGRLMMNTNEALYRTFGGVTTAADAEEAEFDAIESGQELADRVSEGLHEFGDVVAKASEKFSESYESAAEESKPSKSTRAKSTKK